MKLSRATLAKDKERRTKAGRGTIDGRDNARPLSV